MLGDICKLNIIKKSDKCKENSTKPHIKLQNITMVLEKNREKLMLRPCTSSCLHLEIYIFWQILQIRKGKIAQI